MNEPVQRKGISEKSLRNLKPWGPGQSGNPAGRPTKPKCIPEILRRIGEEESQVDPSMTKLEALLRRVYEFAARGEAWAVEFIADRTEGRPVQGFNVSTNDGQPLVAIVSESQVEVNGPGYIDFRGLFPVKPAVAEVKGRAEQLADGAGEKAQ